MVKGSCVCGDWTWEFEGEPAAVVICFCKPCQKTAGANGSYNAIVADDKFKKLSGDDLKYVRIGDSGKGVHYRNCAKCGCVMTGNAEAMEGSTIVKAGTVDDLNVLDKYKPQLEIYTRNRANWCEGLEGAAQKEAA